MQRSVQKCSSVLVRVPENQFVLACMNLRAQETEPRMAPETAVALRRVLRVLEETLRLRASASINVRTGRPGRPGRARSSRPRAGKPAPPNRRPAADPSSPCAAEPRVARALSDCPRRCWARARKARSAGSFSLFRSFDRVRVASASAMSPQRYWATPRVLRKVAISGFEPAGGLGQAQAALVIRFRPPTVREPEPKPHYCTHRADSGQVSASFRQAAWISGSAAGWPSGRRARRRGGASGRTAARRSPRPG